MSDAPDWAIMGVFKVVYEFRKMFGITDQVSFIFDEQRKYAGQIQDRWHAWRNAVSDPPGIREMFAPSLPMFLSDEEIRPLQAADLLASKEKWDWYEKLTGKKFVDFDLNALAQKMLPPGGSLAALHMELQLKKDDLLRHLGDTLRASKT